ncbi:MAG: UDP-N-acetylmuramoyl-tripeptide--D-alanyl-D-alanine ligase [Lachnospiraceae bacterium]|nr:UDP-N-acetylmuramoyl-tripeptide--D-alanyl-D-alanine ligase [Lachnospiraceae bacterium]
MKNLTIPAIAGICKGTVNGEVTAPAREALGFVTDSRQVLPGYVFIAAKGENSDGHNYIASAFEKGALAVVAQHIPEGISPEGPVILVRDSFEALRDIAAFYRRQLGIKVVGITGSVGKTSTKEIIASVLSQRFRTHKTEGNYNNEIGLPLTVLRIPEDAELAVLEMGIDDVGEMHMLSRVAAPDAAVITNIGECHLEKLGDRDGVLREKTGIFEYLSEDGMAFLNGDDDKLQTVKEVKGRKPVSFGLREADDVWAGNVQDRGLLGSTSLIHIGGREIPVQVNIPGIQMQINAAAAAAVGSWFGLTDEEIRKGIEEARTIAGRNNLIKTGSLVIDDDCYNASPSAVRAALDMLSGVPGRRAAVLGDMFELGEYEVRLHEETGAYAAKSGCEVLIFVGDLARHMYEGARAHSETCSQGAEVYYFPDKASLSEALPGLLKKGDTVLVKASHGMGLSETVDFLRGLKLPD